MAQSAFFHQNHRAVHRVSATVVLGITALAMLGLIGCDSESGKADKEVSAKIDAGNARVAALKAAPADSVIELHDAVGITTASSAGQVHAAVAFADSEMRIAQNYAAKAAANDMVIVRLCREINMLTAQIEANNVMVAGLTKYDPAAAGKGGKSLLDSVKEQQSQASNGTGDQGAWMTSLSSLSAVDKQLAAAQAEVTRLTESIKSQTEQRAGLIENAETLNQQSEHEHGDKSVDLYAQGSNMRKSAADLTVKIDTDTAALAKAQADVALAQGQHDSLTAAVKALDDRTKAIGERWTAVQSEIAKLNESSKNLVGSAEPVGTFKIDTKTGIVTTENRISSKAQAIATVIGTEKSAEVIDTQQKLRQAALDHFNKASEQYGKASMLATTLIGEINQLSTKLDPQQQSSEQLAWKEQIKALDAGQYTFLQADADLQRGNLLSTQAGEYKLWLDTITATKKALSDASLEAPKAMNDSGLDKVIADAQGSPMKNAAGGGGTSGARQAYNKAIEPLVRISSGAAPAEIRSAALMDAIYAHLNWSILERSAGDEQEAANQLQMAKTLALTPPVGVTLPPLPLELTQSESALAPIPTDAAAQTGGSPVGTFKNQEPGPVAGMTISQLLEIKADGTFVMNLTFVTAGQSQSHKVTGTWVQTGSKLVCTSKLMDGTPPPASAGKNTNEVTVADGGKRLINADGTPDFIRQ